MPVLRRPVEPAGVDRKSPSFRPAWNALVYDIAPTYPSTRTCDGPPRARRVRWFQARSSAPASHRQRRGCPPERSTICRHVAPCGSVPRYWSGCRGVSGSACRYRCRRRRNTGSARSTRAASARAIPSAASAPAPRFLRNQTAKAPKAAAYISRRGRSSLPQAGFAGSLRSAANQTRIEQRFLRR